MNSSKYRFTLDMHTAQSQVSLPVVLNDTARKFYISLADGGKIYHIADGCLAVIRIGRPTGTHIEHFCPIEDNTNIVYDFAEHVNTAIVAGLHECEVTLYGLDGEILTTARFSMVVSERVVNGDDVEITDKNWTMLDSIATEEARRQDRFNQAMEDVGEAIDGIDDAINEIVPPYVGDNGNWFVHGEDTGTQAQGDPGVYVGSGEMPDGYNIQIDPEGDEVFNPVLSVNGVEPDENGNVTVKVGVDSEELSTAVESALAEAKASGEFDGKDGADGKDGTSVTITDIKESSVDGGNNVVSFSDGKKLNIKNGSAGSPGTGGGGGIDADQLNAAVEEALQNAKDSGEFGGFDGKSVIAYGAKGDGATDDTAAFQDALANNRIVHVPEGTYKLSGTLVIRPNCRLELSQATVLQFTQTTGNCIEMYSSATINGNHAVIDVPYAFSGHVIDVLTSRDTNRDTPPFEHWDPQWKRARYIYNVCIVKHESHGLHYSADGTCSGVGIYMSCISTNTEVGFIWGAMLQGIRIAGAFTYGIQVINYDDPNDSMEDDAWNHDMRVEAVIQGCETGVTMTNCNTAHLAVTVQPSTAENGTKYAKWGVRLDDCRSVDMSSSLIWDWQVARTDSEEYQHIALYGNCRGLVLSDFLYYETATDIRKQIYTDTPSNLENMTILQEPITRWFKQKNGVPYYNDGFSEKQLATKDELDSYFDAEIVKGFTDVLATSTDASGNIYNGIGYEDNTGYYDSAWSGYTVGKWHFHTGFIPVKAGDVIYGKGLSFNKAYDGNCRVVFFTSAFSNSTNNVSCKSLSAENLVKNGGDYYLAYEGDEDSFKLTVKAKDGSGYSINTNIAFVRFQMLARAVGELPMMSVNEEIKYSAEGLLADGIKVKYENIIGATASIAETPVKGVDYYTEADKAEMVDLVLAALPEWNGGSY